MLLKKISSTIILLVIFFSFFLLTAFSLVAQGPVNDPPAREDVFFSRRVMRAIDLQEKVNYPLIHFDDETYVQNDKSAPVSKSVIRELVLGYKDLKYPGYKVDSLDVVYPFESFFKKITRFESTISSVQELTDESGTGFESFSGDDTDNFGEFDDFDFGDPMDDFGEEAGGVSTEAPSVVDWMRAWPTTRIQENAFFRPLENTLIIIEDVQFDKERSETYYDGKYIILLWVDPMGKLPTEAVVAFDYEFVLPHLRDVLVKNWHNDAEYRSAQEILELRRYNSYATVVSGRLMNSLSESQKRSDEMVAFEHNLWEY